MSTYLPSFSVKNWNFSLNISTMKELTNCVRLISRKLKSGTYNSHGRVLDNCGFTYAARRAYYFDDPMAGYISLVDATRNDTTRFSNWINGRFPFRGRGQLAVKLAPYRAWLYIIALARIYVRVTRWIPRKGPESITSKRYQGIERRAFALN